MRSGQCLSWSLLSLPSAWYVARAPSFVLKGRMIRAILGQCWGKGGAREIHSHSRLSEFRCHGEKALGTRGMCWPPGTSSVLVTLAPGSQTSAESEVSATQLRRVTANISYALTKAEHSPSTWQVLSPLILTRAIPTAQMRKLTLSRSCDLPKVTQPGRGVAKLELSC